MKLYRRENYLKRIRSFYHDTELIKVITGVRRCGKSSLMKTIMEELLEAGVKSENIIYINLDAFGFKSIKTQEKLEEAINERAKVPGVKYLFVDEIQNVKDFEETLNAYRETEEFSLFITGSNSYLLSGELITKLTGRYIEFEMTTLTFEEYLGMKSFYGKPILPDLKEELDYYILEGGFPKSMFYDSRESRIEYTESVIKEILEKDIKRRVKISNLSVFNKIQTYMINNYGASTSLSSILDELHKGGCGIKRETLHRYIQILVDAKILMECKRFDLKTKKSMNTEQKYYLSDLSFYHVANTNNIIQYGPALENVVYLYAKSKNYSISVGRIGKRECDFILRSKSNGFSYVQVCMTFMDSQKTEDREYASLEAIKDNYPKYILTRDDPIQTRNGIITKKIPTMIKNGELF